MFRDSTLYYSEFTVYQSDPLLSVVVISASMFDLWRKARACVCNSRHTCLIECKIAEHVYAEKVGSHCVLGAKSRFPITNLSTEKEHKGCVHLFVVGWTRCLPQINQVCRGEAYLSQARGSKCCSCSCYQSTELSYLQTTSTPDI